MRPADLIRRSSFRLAMMLGLFIVVTLLLAGGVGFGLMHEQLSARQNARVMEMFRSLEQAMTAGDERDLIEIVTSRIMASPDQTSVYLLKDETGRVLAGNIKAIVPPQGWSTIPTDAEWVAADYAYRVFTGTSGRYTLSVGLTDADVDDLRKIMAVAMAWAAVTVLLAAFAVGAVFARRMDRRLVEVNQTMNRVAHGDLAARLGLSGQGDDLDQLATTINGALARLQGVVEAMRQVSTDIAHDLRTPLNRLRIGIETASEKAEAGEPIVDDLAAAMSEADQISKTFSALLRIAQIETGSRTAGFRPVDLGALLENVVEVYRPVAEDAGQRLTTTPLQAGQIDGDPELLTQLIANLIENAIQHCPADTAISCSVFENAGRVVISVSDTGPGIPASERENVQRRLYRLEKSRTTQGSGLGLSLVRAIAELHHARLILRDSNPRDSTGLTIEISFPLA